MPSINGTTINQGTVNGDRFDIARLILLGLYNAGEKATGGVGRALPKHLYNTPEIQSQIDQWADYYRDVEDDDVEERIPYEEKIVTVVIVHEGKEYRVDMVLSNKPDEEVIKLDRFKKYTVGPSVSITNVKKI